jgi:uncharacterized coiled-coil protein SlyX
MLVGDHGRVIPFRRFKGIAIGVVGGLILAVLVIIGLGTAYMLQANKINRLSASLAESNEQIAKLRDEKDLLLAKLVVNKKLPVAQKKINQAASEGVKQENEKTALPKNESKVEKKPPVEAAKPASPPKEKAAKAPAKPVKFNADIRRFNVKYQSSQNYLKCDFRIYNTSKPKKALAGRSVVVFKNLDEPPIKWLAVPKVGLTDGVPNGKRGKSFKINNYRTMIFKAFGLKPPVRFNSVSIYVYSSAGTLLSSREIPIQIDVPAPQPKKVAPKPKVPPQQEISQPKSTTDTQAKPPQIPLTPASPSTRVPAATESAPPETESVTQTPGTPTEPTLPQGPDTIPADQSGADRGSVVPADANATEAASDPIQNSPEKPKTEGERQ